MPDRPKIQRISLLTYKACIIDATSLAVINIPCQHLVLRTFCDLYWKCFSNKCIFQILKTCSCRARRPMPKKIVARFRGHTLSSTSLTLLVYDAGDTRLLMPRFKNRAATNSLTKNNIFVGNQVQNHSILKCFKCFPCPLLRFCHDNSLNTGKRKSMLF